MLCFALLYTTCSYEGGGDLRQYLEERREEKNPEDKIEKWVREGPVWRARAPGGKESAEPRMCGQVSLTRGRAVPALRQEGRRKEGEGHCGRSHAVACIFLVWSESKGEERDVTVQSLEVSLPK